MYHDNDATPKKLYSKSTKISFQGKMVFILRVSGMKEKAVLLI